MSDRFVRKVWRIAGDWTVDAQLVVDRERRRIEKAIRTLRKSDPALADRLTVELDALVIGESPEAAVRLVAAGRGVPGLRNASYLDELVRAVERGAGRLERLEPPPELRSWHSAVVRAHREYEAAVRQIATAGDDEAAVTAAYERVEEARTALTAALAHD